MKTLTDYATLIIFALLTPYITYLQESTGYEAVKTALNQTQIPTSVFGCVLKDGKTETMSFGAAIWGEEEKVTYYIGGAGLFNSPNDSLKLIHRILNYGAYNDELSAPIFLTNGEPDERPNLDELLLFYKGDRHGLSWGLGKGHSKANQDNDFNRYNY
jgi:hypothetical protein